MNEQNATGSELGIDELSDELNRGDREETKVDVKM
jgi:hypothetical protein